MCRAVGVAQVPSRAEQAKWEAAIAEATGAGLRAYLAAYPRGRHVEEARARLAACERTPTSWLEAPREVRYRLTVSPLREAPQTTRAFAWAAALLRGREEARSTCETHRRSGEVRAAEVAPERWRCEEVPGGVACGFDGDIVCHVQERVPVEIERCNEAIRSAARGLDQR